MTTPVQNVVILGGGVGGTIVANLLARKLKRQLERGEVNVTVVDEQPSHVYQPGFMYIAFGHERAEGLKRPERTLLDSRVEFVVGEVVGVNEETRTVELAAGRSLAYDHLVLATGSHILPELVKNFATESHHFYSAEAAQKLRNALDMFTGGKIVVAIAGMPYKCPPAPLEVSFLIEAELRQRGLRSNSEIHYCSPIGRAFTIDSVSEMITPFSSRRASSCTPSSMSRRSTRHATFSRASRARSWRTTSSSSCRHTRVRSS